MNGDTVTATEELAGVTVNGMNVTLPAGVSKVKLVCNSLHKYLYISYELGLRIKPSARVKTMIEEKLELDDYAVLHLKNEAVLNAEDKSDSQVWTDKHASADAWLHGRIFRVASFQTKEMRFVEADLVNQSLKLRVVAKVFEQSNVTRASDYEKAVQDGTIPKVTSGTWYELLPTGVTPDIDSIQLLAGDTLRSAYALENYRQSGRTLLVVRADFAEHRSGRVAPPSAAQGDPNYPREGISNWQQISFDCYYSLAEYQNHIGQPLKNLIAFESDGEEIGNIAGFMGEPDTMNGGRNKTTPALANDAGLKALMEDLDSERNDANFVYAFTTLSLNNLDLYALAELNKRVSVSGSGIWTDGADGREATVMEGGSYIYRLSVMGESETPVSNVVIYDAIERYVPTEEDDDDSDAAVWHGTLRSVDVSSLRELGIAPKVYYSMKDLDLTNRDNRDLGNTDIWSETAPPDMSSVKAIAVDAGKTESGADFLLEQDVNLLIYLHMIAPREDETVAPEDSIFDASDPTDPALNAHAFNAALMTATAGVGGRETVSAYAYTRVGIQ